MRKLKPGRKKLKLKAERIKVLSIHNLKQLHGGYEDHTNTNSEDPDCPINSGVSDAWFRR